MAHARVSWLTGSYSIQRGCKKFTLHSSTRDVMPRQKHMSENTLGFEVGLMLFDCPTHECAAHPLLSPPPWGPEGGIIWEGDTPKYFTKPQHTRHRFRHQSGLYESSGEIRQFVCKTLRSTTIWCFQK